MKNRRVATFVREGTWTPGSNSTILLGHWQAWVDGDGHWRVRDLDNEEHYAEGDIELTEAEYVEAGNSATRRKIRARRAKEAARAFIRSMTRKTSAQLDREIDEALRREA